MSVLPVSSNSESLRFLRNLALLSICMVAVQALPGQARTDAHSGNFSGVIYGPDGSVAVGYFNVSTSDCTNHDSSPLPGDPNYAINEALFQYCDNLQYLDEAPLFLNPPPSLSVPARNGTVAAAPQAASSSSLTLPSSVPVLPFLGNWLVGLSWVPNDPNPANATAAYRTVLRRQSDCSINEDFIFAKGTTPSAANIASLTGAQNYYHKLAGLTTTAGVFANGCDYQVLGLPASNGIQLLGTTSSGAAISAQLAGTGLYVTLTDLTANTTKSTAVTSDPNPGYFYAASLRNNGINDLVETGLTDPVTHARSTAVLLGNGDGTFKPAVYYDVSDVLGGPGGFTIDDVNGDGIADIVVLETSNITNGAYPTYTGTVTTLIGKGDGTFTTGPVSNVTWTSSNLVLTGDFNGDGKNDLMVGGTVLFGAGDGSFTVGPTNAAIAVDNTTETFGNAVGDLRNSGKLDVVVSSPGSISIFYGNGDGTFQSGPRYASLPDAGDVAITDIDGDGNMDIVLGGNTGGTYTDDSYDIQIPMYQILMGRGDGTFVDSVAYSQGSYGNGAQEIASADFNGDGKTDVLVYNRSNGTTTTNQLLMLPGNGTGALGAAVTSAINITPSVMVAAKMRQDTLADAVIAGSSSSAAPELAVLFNNGTGGFAGELDYSLAGSAVSLAVGDFNGDSIPDVAVGESGQGVYVLFGQTNGTLGTPVQVDTSANPTGLAAGSLTTDGRTDLIVADEATGALHVYLGNANSTFTAVTAPAIGATNLNLAALGDLNKDGKLDLILTGFIPGSGGAANVSNVYTLLGNGDGTFQAAKTIPLASVNGTGTTSMALADFNKDGNLDVVAGNPNDYTEVLFGKGDGTLADSTPALGQRPASVAAADLNGDGYPELLVGQSNSTGQGSTLAVLLNQATWAATPTVTVSPSPASITSAQSTAVTVTVSAPAAGGATPTGSVTLTSGSYTSAATALSSGSAVITVPGSSLAVAADTLTATYTPDTASSTIYNGATGTGTVTVTSAPVPGFALSNGGGINFAAGATTGNTSSITVTPSNGFTGAVNLSCAVTTAPAGAASPVTCGVTSAVTISGTAAQNGTLTVSSTTTTTAGAYVVTVTGTSGAITTTTTVNITVTAFVAPASFTVSNSGAITISSPGATTGNTATITITPSGGFTGSVTLTAALATSPAGAVDAPTFSFGATSPVSVTGGAASGTLTVSTTAATTGALVRPNRRGMFWKETGGATLACVLLFGMRRARRRVRVLGLLVLLVLIAGSISSCGGGSGGGSRTNGNPGTTAGSYTITVTGTSGAITQSTTVSLTVN